jgi:uncharacterized membrane protein
MGASGWALPLWLVAFVGSHFLLSHPLRRWLVEALGERGFLGVYSLIAAATLFGALFAYVSAPRALLFSPPGWAMVIAAPVMALASILLVGSFLGNPALPGQVPRRKPPAGVFAITRHPMMWAFALWAGVHALVNGDSATVMLALAIGILALVGAHMQDRKKQQTLGLDWTSYMDRTSYWPLGQQVRGRLPWTSLWPGLVPAIGGLVLFALLIWLHPLLFGVAAVGG